MNAIGGAAEFLLGLPYLSGALLARARGIGASVLVSANAFSRWRNGADGLRDWEGFRHPDPAVVASLPVALDSAGFVAAVRYRGWPWTPDDYLDLCSAAPWRWFASMDWCVEPEVAGNEDVVLDRISGTIHLNVDCLRGAERRGIADRFVPVIQGWEVRHYLRCLDRMRGIIAGRPLIGVGSMCRRHVEGTRGILQVLDALDRELPAGVRCHLFGLKSTGMEEVRGHPRVASFDSQAYGTAARQNALRGGFSKTNAYVADVMEDWHEQQTARLSKPGFSFRAPTALLDLRAPAATDPVEAAIARSAERLRELHDAGEIDWQGLNPRWAYESAFDDEDEAA